MLEVVLYLIYIVLQIILKDHQRYSFITYILLINEHIDHMLTPHAQVNLQTTGEGSVRFNPNLYNSGKVCFFLLFPCFLFVFNQKITIIN